MTPCLSSRAFICFNETRKESPAKTLNAKEEQRIAIKAIKKLIYFKLSPIFIAAQPLIISSFCPDTHCENLGDVNLCLPENKKIPLSFSRCGVSIRINHVDSPFRVKGLIFRSNHGCFRFRM
jgi:hypothetical protein